MKPNGLRQLWSTGRSAINGWLSLPNSVTAEVMAAQGYDSLTIDLQHGLIDYQQGLTMLQALRYSDVTPLVRVPWLDPGIIMKALDAGAYGVICPMINTREQAERLVSYVRYAPEGTRSFGPTRASYSSGADYDREANAQILCLAMVETQEALSNLDEIVATPGLDGIYIGPSDLTLSLTGTRYRTGFDREEPEVVEAIHRILKAAHGAGLRAALHCGMPAYAAKAMGWGFDLITLGSDLRLMSAAAQASVQECRKLLGTPDRQSSPSPSAPSAGY